MDIDKIAALVNTEWELFQRTKNEGGRADCQDDYQTFCVNRGAQAMCWNEEIVESWLSDLATALEEGCNLVTEKYARMMELTSPEEYAELSDSLPEVESSVRQLARELTGRNVQWAEEAAERYPHLCKMARTIHSREDGSQGTSLETYCYGELQTMSLRTLELLRKLYAEKERQNVNLYLEVQEIMLKMVGCVSLEDTENRIADQ